MVLFTAHKHARDQTIASILILVSLLVTVSLSWGNEDGKIKHGEWFFTNTRYLEQNNILEGDTRKWSLFPCFKRPPSRTGYTTIKEHSPKSRGLKTRLLGERFQCDHCYQIMSRKKTSPHGALHNLQSTHENLNSYRTGSVHSKCGLSQCDAS